MKRNFIYQLIYQFLSLALPLVTTPYLARVLGPEALGTYSYANATSSFFGLFILLGVANYGNRVVAMVREDTDQLWQDFWAIFRIQLLACGIVLLAFLFFLGGKWQSLLPYFILHLLSIGLDISWLFFGLEEFRLTTLRSIVIRVLSTMALFHFVKNVHHLPLYTLIVVLTLLSTSLSLWFYLPRIFSGKKREKVAWSASIPHLKGMWLLFIPVLAISAYTTVSKLLLKNLSSTVDVGFYDSVTVMLNVPTAVVNALGTVTLPQIANLLAKDEKKAADTLFYKSFLLALVLVMPVTFGLMAVADTFVPFFYGEGYEILTILIPIMLPSCIFLVIGTVVRTQYLIPHQKDRVYIESVCLAAVVSIGSNWWLVPSLGAVGAAWAMFWANTTVSLWQLWRIRAALNWRRLIYYSLFPLSIGLFMYLVVRLVPTGAGWPGIAWSVLLGAMIYLPGVGIYLKKIW